MRITVDMFRSKAYFLKNALNFFLAFRTRLVQMMYVESFTDNLAYFFARIKTCHRILKNHLHVRAQKASFVSVELSGNIAAGKRNFSRSRFVQPDNASADCAL